MQSTRTSCNFSAARSDSFTTAAVHPKNVSICMHHSRHPTGNRSEFPTQPNMCHIAVRLSTHTEHTPLRTCLQHQPAVWWMPTSLCTTLSSCALGFVMVIIITRATTPNKSHSLASPRPTLPPPTHLHTHQNANTTRKLSLHACVRACRALVHAILRTISEQVPARMATLETASATGTILRFSRRTLNTRTQRHTPAHITFRMRHAPPTVHATMKIFGRRSSARAAQNFPQILHDAGAARACWCTLSSHSPASCPCRSIV